MEDVRSAVSRIESFLDSFLSATGLDLTFQSVASPLEPSICVTFEGPDAQLLTSRNGELLYALEHLAAKLISLEPDEHHLVMFEAASFKANRDIAIQSAALAAIQAVRETDRPYSFPPMNSLERRLLHLALSGSGMVTASSGEGSARHVVLYPQPSLPPRF